LLWRYQHAGGFEEAIAELQFEHHRRGVPVPLPIRAQLVAFRSAVGSMFWDMNAAINSQFEFDPTYYRDPGGLLARFDAIFTLNQDTLLERLYVRKLEVAANPWKGASLPGMRRVFNANTAPISFWSDYIWQPRSRAEFLIEPDLQPIYKLHGSSNWISADGGEMLIIGGEKFRAIASYEVLTWYSTEFERWLSEGVRLMVIGYGFQDAHINRALLAADQGLQLFVVDPRGAGVVQDPELKDLFERTLIGASRRDLLETLSLKTAEYAKIERFFEN
jgi:SIR2-like domain